MQQLSNQFATLSTLPAHGSPRIGSETSSPQHSSRERSSDREVNAFVVGRRDTLSHSSPGASGGRVEEYRERRLFTYAKDILLRKQDDEVLKLFKGAIDSAKRFKAELNKIAGFLHQRKAQIGSIKKDHLAWKDELERSDDKQAWTVLNELYDDIPLLQDPKKVALAFTYMTKLEAITVPLRAKYDELVSVLASPLHHQALEFYKEKKKACKALKVKKTTAEKIEGLFAIFRDIKNKISQTIPAMQGKDVCVVRQTSLLYEELLKFVAYTASTFHPRLKQPLAQHSSDSDSCAGGQTPSMTESMISATSQLSLTSSYDSEQIRESRSVSPALSGATSVTGSVTKYSQPGYALVWSTPEGSKEAEDDPLAEMRYRQGGYADPELGEPSGYDDPYLNPVAQAESTENSKANSNAVPAPALSQGWSVIPSWSSVTNLFGPSANPVQAAPLQEVQESDAVLEKAVRDIEELIKSIQGQELELSKLVPHRSKRRVSAPNEANVRAYVDSATTIELATEDKFRNGQRMTTERLIGPYNGIKEQVEKLELLAKALAKLVSTIEQRIEALCEGQLNPLDGLHSLEAEKQAYKALIQGLEQLIQDEQSSLLKLPLSDRVHAGWYYAAKLLSNVREIKKIFGQFAALVADDFSLYGGAINWLVDYLDPKDARLAGDRHYFNGAVAITRLYASIQSFCQLRKPQHVESFEDKLKCMIYETIEQIIAKKGLCTVELSDKEKNVPALVFSKTSLDDLREPLKGEKEIFPAAVRKYLMKGFLRHLYFSDKRVDPEFELVLDMLKNSPYYAVAFKSTVAQKLDFAKYHAAYMRQTDMNQYSPQIRLMAEALSLLSENQSENLDEIALENLFRYVAARQKLSNVHSSSLNISASQHARLDWVDRQAASIYKKMQPKYPSYFSQLETINIPADVRRPLDEGLYKLIAVSMYADNAKESRKATAELVKILAALSVEDLPEDEWLGNLLAGWCFMHFIAGTGDAITHRDYMLTKVLTQYLMNEQTRKLWNHWYGIGFMEIALYKLAVIREEARGGLYAKISRTLLQVRDQENYEFWKKIVSYYAEFRELFIKSADTEVGKPTHMTANRLLQQVIDAFDTITIEGPQGEENTYLSVARWCYKDMRRQFNSRYL